MDPSEGTVVAGDEPPDILSHDIDGGGNEEPVDGAPEPLPVASQVPTPPELLARVQELEDKRRIAGEAVPVDMEEERRLEEGIRRRQRRTVVCCIVLALGIIGTVLGVTLGRKSAPSPTPGIIAPTPSPTTETFASLEALIESVSFDGGAALSDSLSPQNKALTWLASNQNLEDYPEWKIIQRYVLAVFYYSTNGESWKNRNGWLTDEDECSWYTSNEKGSCDESGAFNRLVLDNNNLMGPLVTELALLSNSLGNYAFKNMPFIVWL